MHRIKEQGDLNSFHIYIIFNFSLEFYSVYRESFFLNPHLGFHQLFEAAEH